MQQPDEQAREQTGTRTRAQQTSEQTEQASTAVRWRRDIHRHPETGFTEFRTASLIAGRLADLGWEMRTGSDAISPGHRLGVPDDAELDAAYARAEAQGADPRFLPSMAGGNTAVVATLRGSRPGPALGIRADIDALPVLESDDPSHLPASQGFRSRNDGLMHACGHDGHIGMAMELAERLTADPPPTGSVTLLFQPAEEGGRGARAMVPAGVADGLCTFIAVHLGLDLPTGSVISAHDGLLANSKLRAVFHGVAAHASIAPHQGRSALLGAAAATLAVHGLPPVPGHETRASVGRISGGTSSNIVPDRAEVLLETRADEGAVNEDLEARARDALRGAAEMYGLTVDVELTGAVTTARADPEAVALVEASARACGMRLVPRPEESGVASDDATALMRRVQQGGGRAGYIGIGADLAAPHHTPRFDFDEAALPLGVGLLEEIVRRPAP